MHPKTYLEDLKQIAALDKKLLHEFLYPDVLQKLVKNSPDKYIIEFEKNTDGLEISITPKTPTMDDRFYRFIGVVNEAGLLDKVEFPLVNLPDIKDVPTYLQFYKREDGVFQYKLFISSLIEDKEGKVDKVIYQLGKDFDFFGYGEKEFISKIDSVYAKYLLQVMKNESLESNVTPKGKKD